MNELHVKCRDCKKTPRNCTCYEYRVCSFTDSDRQVWRVFVDNVATDPVRGQQARVWQPRRNAKMWRAPTYVDAYGPILTTTNSECASEIEAKIESGEFNLNDYIEREDCRVRVFERDLQRRLPFLRKTRAKSKRGNMG